MKRALTFILTSALSGIVMALFSLPGEKMSEQRLLTGLAEDETFQEEVAKKMKCLNE